MLLIPAGVGMTASVALHEIEKLVPRMQESVKSKPMEQALIKDQVEELKQYTDGIISVLRKGGNKPMNIEEALIRSFHNHEHRLSDRHISFGINVNDGVDTINCDKRFFITMIMNLIDNSIYWLDTVYRENKKISVKVFVNIDGFVTVVFWDNGPGFKDDITDLVRPFFSRRDDGIGIGMYLIDTIMMKYGKLDIVTDSVKRQQLGIPVDNQGAAIELIFSKNQE